MPALRSILLAVLLLPALAVAQVSVGLRAGYALPSGNAYEQSGFGTFKEKDLAKGVVPIQLDATWRFTGALSGGIYYAYGFGQTGTKLSQLCSTPGAACDRPNIVRYGVQLAYGLGPTGGFEPWLGLAAGMESATFKVKNFVYGVAPGPPPTPLVADLAGTLRGWETELQGGADYRVTQTFLAGPFISLGLGQYRTQHVTLSGQGTVAGGGVDSAKSHVWMSIGARGRFDL